MMNYRSILGIVAALTLCSLLASPAAAEPPEPVGVLALGGTWSLAADPRNPPPKDYEEGWSSTVRPEAVPVPVPGIIQQALPDAHGWVWYWRKFAAPVNPHVGGRYVLRFEAVDYQAEVWLNGKAVGGHEGPETPFSLDVTDAVRPGGENLLAVRVLNDDAGGTLPNRAKSIFVEWMRYGGITGRVELMLVPAVRIESLYAKPDPSTGLITVEATVRSAAAQAAQGRLEFSVAPAASGAALAIVRVEQALPPGDSVVKAQLAVGPPHLWTLDDPYLYRVAARVATAAPTAADERSTRCGFRDFRVTAGYFTLNGKRIFLRSTHTGNHVPMSWTAPPDNELLRRDLLYAKASGFNTVRFITCAAWSDQLDLCDEIGLMVYQETCAAWGMKDSPQLKERFDRSLREVILRDRNHPSFTILGLMNEEGDTPVFRHAVETLPLIRDLDDTRLVLLSSGRWDRQGGVGSLANPGDRRWQDPWSGDVHFYPPVPQSEGDSRNLRTLGSSARPVFLSEYGIGSLMNVIGEVRHFEQAGARPDLKDFAFLRSQAERLEADWCRLGMDQVYASAEDMLLESQRLHARQRLIGFDNIRANPGICGFNLTGMLDHGLTGEGLWTFWRHWKPGTFDAVSDGWAPLRWCLFVTPMHAYAGDEVQVEAVLANEDVLGPGEYPVRLRVMGPAGAAWERKLAVRIPQPAAGQFPPLAVPVLSEKITLPGPAGEYQFAATMERGGAPAGGRLKFYLGEARTLPRIKEAATVWGLDERAQQWLRDHGVTCRDFEAAAGDPPSSSAEVILVGELAKEPAEAQWKELLRRIEGGSTAVFLSPAAFRHGNDPVGRLPLAKKGRCYDFYDWLYHKECVARHHPIFAGLQGPGVMDWEYYGSLIGKTMFEGQDTPDEVFAAAFAAGYWAYVPGTPCPSGYTSGVLLGSYHFGKGRFVINAFRILESLGNNPAADRLILNLVTEGVKRSSPER